MAKRTVLKDFGYAADHVHVVEFKKDDIGEFGDSTDALATEGFISKTDASGDVTVKPDTASDAAKAKATADRAAAFGNERTAKANAEDMAAATKVSLDREAAVKVEADKKAAADKAAADKVEADKKAAADKVVADKKAADKAAADRTKPVEVDRVETTDEDPRPAVSPHKAPNKAKTYERK